jgi:hypothetical protein
MKMAEKNELANLVSTGFYQMLCSSQVYVHDFFFRPEILHMRSTMEDGVDVMDQGL